MNEHMKNLSDEEVEVLAAAGFEDAERELQRRSHSEMSLTDLWALVACGEPFAYEAIKSRATMADVIARFNELKHETACHGSGFDCEGTGTVAYLNEDGGYIVQDVTDSGVVYEFNPDCGEPVVFTLKLS